MDIVTSNIILEGCDCTGKSSIAKLLHRKNPQMTLKHFSAPKNQDEAQAEYQKWVHDMNYTGGFILDRFMLGETVYAPKYRGYYPKYMRWLEDQLLPHSVLFLVQAHESVVRQRFDGEFIKEKDIPDILERYRKEFNESRYKHKFIIDTTVITPEDAAESICTLVHNIKDPITTRDRSSGYRRGSLW